MRKMVFLLVPLLAACASASQQGSLGLPEPNKPRWLIELEERTSAEGILLAIDTGATSAVNLAVYAPEDSRITLNLPLIEEKARFDSTTVEKVVLDVTVHEICHHRANVLSKKFGRGAYPSRAVNKYMKQLRVYSEMELMGMLQVFPGMMRQFILTNRDHILPTVLYRMVVEGIAGYCAGDGVSAGKWPENFSEIASTKGLREFIYGNGLALVTPIIDQFGDQGMLYLMKYPPTPEDFLAMEKYQDLAFRVLGKVLADSVAVEFNLYGHRGMTFDVSLEVGKDVPLASYSFSSNEMILYWNVFQEQIESAADTINAELYGFKKQKHMSLSEIVYHEVAHFITDSISEARGLGIAARFKSMKALREEYENLLRKKPLRVLQFVHENRQFVEGLITFRMIIEGIAVAYAARGEELGQGAWFNRVSAIYTSWALKGQIYKNGGWLMQPIVDGYGVECIAHVLNHMPSVSFTNRARIVEWRDRELEHLKSGTLTDTD